MHMHMPLFFCAFSKISNQLIEVAEVNCQLKIVWRSPYVFLFMHLLYFLWNMWLITLSLPVINFNFIFQSFTRDISYSMENLAIDSLLKEKLIEQSFLTTSLNHFLL